MEQVVADRQLTMDKQALQDTAVQVYLHKT
jgi:hypothetical protein